MRLGGTVVAGQGKEEKSIAAAAGKAYAVIASPQPSPQPVPWPQWPLPLQTTMPLRLYMPQSNWADGYSQGI